MTIAKHREKIGKFIIVAHLSIFILIFVLFGLGGFTSEELGEVLKFLIPIKTIYITALIKFVITNKKKVANKNQSEDDTAQVDTLYKNVTNIFIYSHIILLAIAITIAAFNIITFTFLQNAIAIIETFFGAYIGFIITDMFKADKD
jgi:protein-S-isoprenylcysteine O-methyltransferase Ste14